MSRPVPVIPDSAPFTAEQRAWLNGFFAGLFSRAPSAGGVPSPRESAAPLAPLTVLFGSQTGTAEGLAKRAAKEAGKHHFAPTVLDLAACDVARLAGEKNVLLVVSTYGDGEPPDSARALHAALGAESATLPASLRFAVCALGDTNYPQFCKCGADFDRLLAQRGATRVLDRVDCDLDYEEKFTRWLSAAFTALGSLPSPPPDLKSQISDLKSPISSLRSQISDPTSPSRTHPFLAPLLASRNLNAAGSAKQVNHVEFDLAGSGLTYEAGDALGVFPHNCPALVAELLTTLGCDGEEAVPAPDGATTSLRRALTELYDLGKPTPELLAHFAPATAGRAAEPISAPHHIIDLLLARRDLRVAPADFVRTLKKLQPRLYSISSSPRAHAGQVHLTVGAVRYELHGRTRQGVCSTFLADRVVPGETRVGVFVHRNSSFRLPASGDTAVIMIGPGTGIAPFRGFLHERRAAAARGKNWLFFGDQRAATDFLYRDELDELTRSGTLTHLTTAFSRDQAEKIYVQHRMLEHAAELFAWLEAGAHLYVCGDASRMAKDVDAALHLLVAQAGRKTADQAATYVDALRAAKRYCRDVY
jgi:sulfite reductase (NADPH) flavoprotein alpha-component